MQRGGGGGVTGFIGNSFVKAAAAAQSNLNKHPQYLNTERNESKEELNLGSGSGPLSNKQKQNQQQQQQQQQKQYDKQQDTQDKQLPQLSQGSKDKVDILRKAFTSNKE